MSHRRYWLRHDDSLSLSLPPSPCSFRKEFTDTPTHPTEGIVILPHAPILYFSIVKICRCLHFFMINQIEPRAYRSPSAIYSCVTWFTLPATCSLVGLHVFTSVDIFSAYCISFIWRYQWLVEWKETSWLPLFLPDSHHFISLPLTKLF